VYSSAKLIAAFSHIPGSSHNASLEAGIISNCIKSSFFAISNLTGLGFHDANDKLVANVTLDPASRPAGILYFAFRSLINPHTTDPSHYAPDIIVAEPAPTMKPAPAQKKRKGITTRWSGKESVVNLTQANTNGQFQSRKNKQSEKEYKPKFGLDYKKGFP
jgi:hypothetical protein